MEKVMVFNRNLYGFLSIGALSFLLVMAVDLPRATAFMPGVIALVALIAGYVFLKQKPQIPTRIVLICAAILFLCATSALWAVSAEEVFERTIKLSGVFFAGILVLSFSRTINISNAKPALWLLPVGIAAGSLLIVVELLWDAPLYRAIRDVDTNEGIPDAVFNRGAVALTICFFPAFFYLLARNYKKSAALLVFCLFIMLAVSECQSAQLAVFIGLVTCIIFPYKTKQAWYGLVFLISGLIITAPFLAIMLFNSLAHTINEMPFFGHGDGYGGARLEIWDYISRYTLDNPLYGFGLEASRAITDFDTGQIFQAGTTILHPHNFALQLWLEFGVIGAVAGCLFCGYIILSIFKLSLSQRRVALATFMACLSVAATGYGMWQSWWVGLLFLAAAFTTLVIRAIGESEKNKAVVESPDDKQHKEQKPFYEAASSSPLKVR